VPKLPDWLAARVRTAWPMILGYLAARLFVIGAPVADWLSTNLGIEVTQPQVAIGVSIALGYGIYEAGRWLEQRPGQSRPARLGRGLGRWLLSLGLTTGQPVYALPGQQVSVLNTGGILRPPR
jgi:hypothetical protein